MLNISNCSRFDYETIQSYGPKKKIVIPFLIKQN